MNSEQTKGLPVKANTIIGFKHSIASKVKVNLPLIFQIK